MIDQWLDENNRQTKPKQLFALIDSAADASLPERLLKRAGKLNFRCLFDHKSPALYDIAPFLIQIETSGLLSVLIREMAQAPLGFFVLSWDDIDQLHQHFTGCLAAVLPSGVKATFRFYDPRILLTFCRTNPAGSIKRLIGFDNLVIVPDLDQRVWLLMNNTGKQLQSLNAVY